MIKNLDFEAYCNVQIIATDFPSNLSLQNVCKLLNSYMPAGMLSPIDVIYIGKFDFLDNFGKTSTLIEDAIYVNSEQTSEKEIVKDIIHEIAHIIEPKIKIELRKSSVVSEFLTKRKQLFYKLKEYCKENNYTLDNFINTNYDEQFEDFLFNDVGFKTLQNINIFPTPYGILSLQEYFSSAFEDFYMIEQHETLKNRSPALFKFLERLHEEFKRLYHE